MNRNYSSRSSTTVPSLPSVWNCIFFTTLLLTKRRTILSHMKGQVSNHSQKDSLPATYQKLVICVTGGKLLGSGSPNQQKDLTSFTLVKHNSSTHDPQPLAICAFVLQQTDCFFFIINASLTQFQHYSFPDVISHCSSCMFFFGSKL